MTKSKQQYDLYINTPSTGTLKAANAVCIEENGRLQGFGFRYTQAYLEQARSFAFDPIQLPLKAGETQLSCSGGIPGVLDDYLPDDWGRRVLAHLAYYRDKKKLDSNSCIEILSLLSNSRIGALQWTMPGTGPDYALGSAYTELAKAENAAQCIDDNQYITENVDEMSLLYLANAGTGVGGARPKALIEKEGKAYLAKFNRLHDDRYNNARVELACLNMARSASIHAYGGSVEQGINDREVLMLERFDVLENNTRLHVISVNALLKTSAQADRGGVFRYDDIADLVRQHSINVETDLIQLLKIMLFNRGINNIDDHERNFSFINNGDGFKLSPAYDMVPSLITGAYHVAGFGYKPNPPRASEVHALGKVFGLPKTKVSHAAEEIIDTLDRWVDFAEKSGVSEQDTANVLSIIRP